MTQALVDGATLFLMGKIINTYGSLLHVELIGTTGAQTA